MEVTYAKKSHDSILARVKIANRGPESATLHLLPTLWFRNTWSWGDEKAPRPLLQATEPGRAAWSVEARHAELGTYFLYGGQNAELLFTENESDTRLLFGMPNQSRYVKNAFHRRVIHDDREAVNPAGQGTKFAAWHIFTCGPGEEAAIDLVLTPQVSANPFDRIDDVFREREREAKVFYDDLLPGANEEDASGSR